MRDAVERKRKLLAAELQRYFGETCPALTARWETAITGLAPPVLRELADRLWAFEALTNEIDRNLSDARAATTKNEASAENLLDRALASVERLGEAADEIMQRLNQLLKA